MITQTSKREVSENTMKELLALAQNIKSSGTGELPLDKLAEAKTYFGEYKKQQIGTYQFKIIAFMLFAGVLTLFKNIEKEPLTIATLLYFGAIFYYNYATLKYNYVVSMLGDLTHLDYKQREFYTKGLLKTLWKTNKEYTYKFNFKKFAILTIFALIPLIPLFLFDPYLIVFKDINLLLISKVTIGFMAFFALILKFKDEPFA